jgi:2-phospho-L-lactate/phosphoenolpyruvate guanylyltransferase
MAAHVLVPVKAIDPKSRLAAVLDLAQRGELMAELLQHVTGAVREAGIDTVTVVCSEPLDGYRTWLDGGLSWNDALATAAREVVAEPVVAFISADLPRLRADDVVQLLDATPERGIAIGRAHDGGTNAIAMRPPGLLTTRFGEPQSAALHAALGVESTVVDVPGIAFDIDTPEDLAKWR